MESRRFWLDMFHSSNLDFQGLGVYRSDNVVCAAAKKSAAPAFWLGAAQFLGLEALSYCAVLRVGRRGAGFGFSLTGGLSGSGSGWVISPTTVNTTLGVAV